MTKQAWSARVHFSQKVSAPFSLRGIYSGAFLTSEKRGGAVVAARPSLLGVPCRHFDTTITGARGAAQVSVIEHVAELAHPFARKEWIAIGLPAEADEVAIHRRSADKAA